MNNKRNIYIMLIFVLSTLVFISCTKIQKQKSKNKIEQITIEDKIIENEGIEKESIKKEVIKEKEIQKRTIENLEESLELVYYDFSNVEFAADFSKSTTHYFSNSKTKDIFTIFIPKGNIKKTKGYILIEDVKKDTILYRKFATHDMIYGYKLAEMKSDGEVVKHIKERVESNLISFIDTHNKKGSQILHMSIPDDFEDYETFKFCKENNLPIFVFTLGNENSTFYGFSNNKLKAVPILYCC